MSSVGSVDKFESYDQDASTGASASMHAHEKPVSRAPMAGSGFSRSIIVYALIAIALALFIRFFIAAPYMVSGASMDPTFESWDYLIVDRVTYRFEQPQRGDVVVFRFPQDPSRSFIKRVIGLPGDTVVLEGTSVSIMNDEYPDGFTLDEPYIAAEHVRGANMRVTLDSDEYFVLGDNRAESADSRVWGTLPQENIVGRAFARLYPLSMIDIWPGETRYSTEAQ